MESRGGTKEKSVNRGGDLRGRGVESRRRMGRTTNGGVGKGGVWRAEGTRGTGVGGKERFEGRDVTYREGLKKWEG